MLKAVIIHTLHALTAHVKSEFIHFADAVVRGSTFGPGTGPIYLDDPDCFGNESRLVDCYYIPNDDCVHSQDVGVLCNTTRK